jgi:hypothetical protein
LQLLQLFAGLSPTISRFLQLFAAFCRIISHYLPIFAAFAGISPIISLQKAAKSCKNREIMGDLATKTNQAD